MRFDDRLKTVLAQQPQYAHDRAVRWRQLVELLARGGGGAQTPLVQQAFEDVRSVAGAIDEQLRAATARAIASAKLPAELVALFAADNIAVAAPVLAAANLSQEEWRRVLEQASPNSRRFLRSLHPELLEEGQKPEPEPQSEPQVEQAPAAEAPPPAGQQVPSISEVVARVERLRQEREQLAHRPPRLRESQAVAGGSSLFRWECGPSGEIAWVDGVPRGPLIGRSLANPGEHNGVDERIQRAFAVRAPFREASLSISGEGIAAGEWKLSGVPAFEPLDGRFAGYRGVAVRGEVAQPPPAEPPRGPRFDNDSIRDLVHELKTPLNAIIGFAEIIDGQYLGPADHSYRQRASEIVAQARLLLSAIEDLDLAAQLRSAPEQAGGSTDLRELVARASTELVEQAGRRGATLLLELPAQPVRCGVESGLAGRIVRRFCSAIIDAASPGERLGLSVAGEKARCLVSLEKPQALRAVERQGVPGAPPAGDQAAGLLSTGVSLRLARALCRVAGGDLVDTPERALLVLPRAD